MNVAENSFMKKIGYIMSERSMKRKRIVENIRICMTVNMLLLLKKMLMHRRKFSDNF